MGPPKRELHCHWILVFPVVNMISGCMRRCHAMSCINDLDCNVIKNLRNYWYYFCFVTVGRIYTSACLWQGLSARGVNMVLVKMRKLLTQVEKCGIHSALCK